MEPNQQPIQPVTPENPDKSPEIIMKPSSNTPLNKNRGLFWVIAPSSSIAIGIILLAINGATPSESPVHIILNLVVFLSFGFGVIAFIPGLIYGIKILNRKA